MTDEPGLRAAVARKLEDAEMEGYTRYLVPGLRAALDAIDLATPAASDGLRAAAQAVIDSADEDPMPAGWHIAGRISDLRAALKRATPAASDESEERERDLRQERVETAKYHVAHDGSVRHPEGCNDCRALAERGTPVEEPR